MPIIKSIRLYHFLSVFVLCLLGCPKPHLGFNEPPDKEPETHLRDTTSNYTDTLNRGSNNLIDENELKNIIINEEFLQQRDEEKLTTVARLLENARALMFNDQLVAAGYSFALARMMLASICSDSLGAEVELYHSLVKEVNHFYEDYVHSKDELPAESPPEAIIAGVEEAESDTSDEDDLLSLNDLPIDTTALIETLAKDLEFPEVPFIINNQVENAIRFFQTKGRKVYQRWLTRAEVYEPMMRKILKEEGMPEDLVYVCMIESGFNPIAYSYAHASGPWQFIKSTGKIFGLKMNWWYDERRDPVKSTYAAIRYLKKLYYDFEDWYLAIAAYNCGEKNVKKHINRYNTKDFWSLTRLPRQTRNYVPTFIAAGIIAKNPAAYGFMPPVYRGMPAVDSVVICEQVDLKLVAKLIGSTYEELKELNPSLLKWCTPPPPDTTILILPLGTASKFLTEWANLPKEYKKVETRHIVKRGETLGSIAKRYGVSVRDICAVAENRIRNQNKLSVGQMLIIPVPPEHYKKSAVEYQVAEAEEPITSKPSGNEIMHIVRSGETLGSIAENYNTTVSALISRNRIKNARKLKVGQTLVVKPGVSYSKDKSLAATSTEKSKSPSPTPQTNPTTREHTVKKGETLTNIAMQYEISVSELMKANNLNNPHNIKAGTRICIPSSKDLKGGSSSTIVHTVRPGDTLWAIARKYGVNQEELMRVNSLNKRSKIMPGDRLKIPQG